MRRSARLGLLVAAVAIAAAAQLAAVHPTTAPSAAGRRGVDHGVVSRHDHSAVVPVANVPRAASTARGHLAAALVAGLAVAALAWIWLSYSARRRGRVILTITAFQRRGPPCLQLVA